MNTPKLLVLVLLVVCLHGIDLNAQSAASHVASARAVAYKPGEDFTWVFNQNCTEVKPPVNKVKREPSLNAKVPPRSEWYYGEPVKVFDNLYYVGTQLQSMWAITTSEGIILHDTAYNYMIKDVEEGMKKVGLDPKQIKYIIISHAHTDHYLGARYLQDTYHPHVIMSEADWKYAEKDFAEKDKTMGAQMPVRDMVATDGMKLTLGDTTLTMYVTPGHTPGTISTLIPVRDGNQRHLASLWGGSGVGYDEMISAWPSYLDSVKAYAASAKRYKEIVTKAGADVYLSSHTVHDHTPDKLNSLRFRNPGDPHPFVSKDAVGRHLTLVAECAEAQVAWWAGRDNVEKAEPAPQKPTIVAADDLEQKIWNLLDDSKSVYVTLPESDFRALGARLNLPDGGKTVTDLALKAPGGAFDPRDLEKIPAEKLGYKADWIVERYKRYNLDWDITGLRLTSLDPDAKKYPWLIIMNGGAANFYEFYVDLKNRPGWAQYLAQKLNVMIITIPGNFKYGGWDEPIQSVNRQPAYLLDRQLSMDESIVRNCLLNNAVVFQGVKALIMNHTQGDLLMIGHSTSGEISMLANDDADLRARLNGRYLGWGSGGPARLDRVREAKEQRHGAGTAVSKKPLELMERRDPPRYANGYSWFLNPLYEPGMSPLQIAERWLDAEKRRRANFKQQIQDLEHGGDIQEKGRIEVEIENLLKKTGNPWGVNLEDVSKDLFITHFTRMDGYKQMVWTVGHFDRNHWLPEDPMKAVEVFVANEYRAKNPNAKVRLIVWDPPMTHYGHLELPKQLAAADYSVIRWFFK